MPPARKAEALKCPYVTRKRGKRCILITRKTTTARRTTPYTYTYTQAHAHVALLAPRLAVALVSLQYPAQRRRCSWDTHILKERLYGGGTAKAWGLEERNVLDNAGEVAVVFYDGPVPVRLAAHHRIVLFRPLEIRCDETKQNGKRLAASLHLHGRLAESRIEKKMNSVTCSPRTRQLRTLYAVDDLSPNVASTILSRDSVVGAPVARRENTIEIIVLNLGKFLITWHFFA